MEIQSLTFYINIHFKSCMVFDQGYLGVADVQQQFWTFVDVHRCFADVVAFSRLEMGLTLVISDVAINYYPNFNFDFQLCTLNEVLLM